MAIACLTQQHFMGLYTFYYPGCGRLQDQGDTDHLSSEGPASVCHPEWHTNGMLLDIEAAGHTYREQPEVGAACRSHLKQCWSWAN